MLLLKLLTKIPLGLSYSLSNVIVFFMRHVLRYRMRLVRENLSNAFPDKTRDELEDIAQGFYRNIVEVAVETIRTGEMDEAELLSRVSITNPEVLDAYRENGQSIILVGSHQANWEWCLLACSLQLPFPMEVVYKKLHTDLIDRFLARSRTRFGARLIPDRVAFKELMYGHKNQRIVAMMADQRPARKEPRYWTKFLRQDTAFHTGWAKLAQFTKYPVWYAHCARVDRGHYQITLDLIAEPPYSTKVDPLVESFAQAAERSIVQDPSVWLWTHRRWRYPKPLYE